MVCCIPCPRPLHKTPIPFAQTEVIEFTGEYPKELEEAVVDPDVLVETDLAADDEPFLKIVLLFYGLRHQKKFVNKRLIRLRKITNTEEILNKV